MAPIFASLDPQNLNLSEPFASWLAALHDFRQPVQGARLITEVVLHSKDPARRIEAQRTLLIFLEQITDMLDEMQQLVLWEAGAPVLTVEQVDLSAEFAQATEAVRALRPGMSCNLEWEATEPVRIAFPKGVVATIVRGLVFSLATFQAAQRWRADVSQPAGTLELTATVEDTEALGTRNLEMFTAFNGDSQNGERHGTVLMVPGLALVRRLVEVAGGRVAVNQEPGGARNLRITMPLGRTEASSATGA
ncbi:MAG: sensor histidine kinase [Hyphomicrobiaceae bacterium]